MDTGTNRCGKLVRRANSTYDQGMPRIAESLTNFLLRKPEFSGAVQFTAWKAELGGSFRFDFELPKATPYDVQISTDLKEWTSLNCGTSQQSSVQFLDKEAEEKAFRFYRVVTNTAVSRNLIGFWKASLPPGFSMISNPFVSANNNYEALFPQIPENCAVHRFDLLLFRLSENEFKGGKWVNPHETLSPGEGAIFQNTTARELSYAFTGEIPQGELSLPLPSGFSIRSSMLPLEGRLQTDLLFPVGEGDAIHLFDRRYQQYRIHSWSGGKWAPNEPTVAIGQSFWVGKSQPANWQRTFRP
jgi:hypothetical protein